MLASANVIREFLSEVNSFFTQDEYNKKLYDLFTPIRNLLLNQKDLLSYSFARHSGADTKLAFLAEWIYQSNLLTFESELLFQENQKYFRKKIPIKLRGVPGLYDKVDKDIKTLFQPQQIALLHIKTQDLIKETLVKNQFLNKYLSPEYLTLIPIGEIGTKKLIYSESITLSQYLESQSIRISFAKIGLPCLLGLSHYFYKKNNKFNPKIVSWPLLEELLRSISLLYQTNHSKDLINFIYTTRLSEKEQFTWFQKPIEDQYKIASKSREAEEILAKQRLKIQNSAKSTLNQLNLPANIMRILSDLIVWSYGVK